MKKIILGCMAVLAAMSMAAQTEVTPEQDGNANPQSVTITVPSNNAANGTYTDEYATQVVLQRVYNWADHRHNISFSVGLPGLYSTAISGHSWKFYLAKPGTTTSGTTGTTGTTPSGTTVRSSEFFCGSWAFEYDFQVLRWLRVGTELNYEYWMGNTRTHDAALMAKVAFTYINQEHIRLYSGVGVGIGMHIDGFSDGTIAGRYLPAIVGTPIGLQAGNAKVYALVETNIGSASFLRVGIGFRP